MSQPTPHLLAVDDDPEVTDLICAYLGKQGFRVSAAHSAEQMNAQLERDPVDLVLLDLGLPDADGLALTRRLREHWHGAVIIVSGRGDTVDRTIGLELGADDYLAKPFDLRELLARVRSVLRRAQPTTNPARQAIHFGDWIADLGAREVRHRNGELVSLTSGEFDLLSVFLRHPQRVLSRDQIMDLTRHRDAGPFDRAIDMQVGRLRRKLEIDPAQPQLFKAVRGAGYMLAIDAKPGA